MLSSPNKTHLNVKISISSKSHPMHTILCLVDESIKNYEGHGGNVDKDTGIHERSE